MPKPRAPKAKAKKNQRTPIIAATIVVVAAVLIAVVVMLTRTSSTNAPKLISPSAYMQQFVDAKATHTLIDVRTAEEFASGHIAGAVNIPVEVLASRLSDVPRDRTVVVYCRSGNRSKQAAEILSKAGYSDIRDLGGLNAWSAQGLPVTQ